MKRFKKLLKCDDINIKLKLIDISLYDSNLLANKYITVFKFSNLGYSVIGYPIEFVKTDDEYFYLLVGLNEYRNSLFNFLTGAIIPTEWFNFYKCDQIEGLIECIKMLENE